MSSPIGSVTFDKTAYLLGETITATVNFSDPDSKSGNAAFDLVDSTGNVTQASATFVVTDPVGCTPNIANDRTWTLVPGSKTAASAKFTATA